MRIDALEHETVTGISMTEDQARALRSVVYSTTNGPASPVMDVRVGSSKGRYDLRTRGVCGSFAVNGSDVIIRPRVEESLLEQMLSRSSGVRFTLSGPVSRGDTFESRVDVSFLNEVDRICRLGLASAYQTRSEVGSAPRGAIDFGWFSNPITLELKYSYPDFSRDVPENQQIVAALQVVGSASRMSGRPSSRARRLRSAFEGIYPDAVPKSLHKSTSFERYRTALALADLILGSSRASAISDPSAVAAQGILYEPYRFFESYVQDQAARVAESTGAQVDRNSSEHPIYLEAGHRWRVYPDVAIWSGGACLAVVDAKYKPTSHVPSRDDLYQALAYAVSFGADAAVLVYASGRTSCSSFNIGADGLRVTVIELDVSYGDIGALDAVLWKELSIAIRRSAR